MTRLPMRGDGDRPAPVHIAVRRESRSRLDRRNRRAARASAGNGRYSLMITNSGGGYSRWNDFDVTRWRSDTDARSVGQLHLHPRYENRTKCGPPRISPLPARRAKSRSASRRTALKFTGASPASRRFWKLRWRRKTSRSCAACSITNRSLRTRQLEFTSYVELAMTPHAADKAHPAFAKMFVETECPEPGVLIAHRRPRSPGDPPIWTAHDSRWIAPRGRGTGHSVRNRPAEVPRPRQYGGKSGGAAHAAEGSMGTVIDPIFSLRCRVTLEPRDRKEIAFLTMAASSREALMELVAKYTRLERCRAPSKWRGRGRNWCFASSNRPGAAHRFQELASQLMYRTPGCGLRRTASRAIVWGRRRCGHTGSPAICPWCWSRLRKRAICRWCGKCCWRTLTGGCAEFKADLIF